MRVLFIKLPEPAAPVMRRTYVPPIGLWAMRETIRATHQDWTVHVVDMHLGAELPPGDYDLVGISAQFSTQHALYEELAATARRRWPRATVIAGGFHASAVKAPPGVDQVIHGSGEAYFAGGDRRRWRLPKPSYCELEDYWRLGAPHDLQSASSRWFPIETSRGCSRSCHFCGVHRYWGRWEAHCATELVAQLEHLTLRLGVEEVFVEDDNVALDRTHFEAVVQLLEEFGLRWSTPNGIDIRGMLLLLPRLRASGCWRLSLPFETGSEHTAGLMGIGEKWLAFDDALQVVARVRDQGIEACGFFIIGYPGESLEDIERTLEYANALPLDARHIYIATPYPGTRLLEVCRRNGWLRYQEPELYGRLTYTQCLVDTPDWRAEDVTAIRARDREAAIARRNGGSK